MQDLFEAPRRRPLGISIISVLLFISAIVEIFFGLFILFATIFTNLLAALLVGWIPLAIGVISLILAWGLWTLKPWAFWATIILEVINIVIHLFSLGQANHSLGNIFGGGIISLIILIYMLVDRNVRQAFQA